MKALLTILLLLGMLGSLSAQMTGRRSSAQAFSTFGLDDSGNLRWSLEGDSINFKGNIMGLKEEQARIVTIRNCRATMHGSNHRQFVLRTPSCNLLMALRELKSDSVLQFSTDGFEGSCIGYDVNLEQRILRLRSTVHIIIQRQAAPNLFHEKP